MDFRVWKLVIAAALFGSLSFSPVASVANTSLDGTSATRPDTRIAATVSGRTGEVYLLRGLMDVFSQGMDTLGRQLDEKGFTTVVTNHSAWPTLAKKITERYKASKYPEPVFLVGHSLGADAVILLCERLAQNGVPVALAVTFDPVHPRVVPTNVKRFVNFYQSNNGWGAAVKPGPGFKATLVNTDLKDRTDIHHTTIDKADFLHTKVIEEMMKLSRPIRRQATG
ncbi:hypothetical protein [Microbaculum marinum]|uniref:Thioesterase domain-containing protein n=1 Tax=Microbaculum marinum TaxID=1764581 RepID=A0AAW9RHI2_9HYPH